MGQSSVDAFPANSGLTAARERSSTAQFRSRPQASRWRPAPTSARIASASPGSRRAQTTVVGRGNRPLAYTAQHVRGDGVLGDEAA